MNLHLWLVMTTVENRTQAERLAAELVERRLAACVSIGASVTSVYPWQGQIETTEETPLMIKTSPQRLDALKSALEKLHPYEVPEMLVLPVNEGLPAYFAWAHEWTNHEN